MKIFAVVEKEHWESPVYHGYYDTLEKAEAKEAELEAEYEWDDSMSFWFEVVAIDVE